MSSVVWFTGLSGAGKSTIAESLKTELVSRGKSVRVLDGDVVRDKLHRHLGFTQEDIKENNRLIAGLARECAQKEDVILVPIISPFVESRALAREIVGEGFVELYVESSEATRIARDPKGLYKKVREGSITNFVGHGGVPYEIPEHPDIIVNTDTESPVQSVERILRFLMQSEYKPNTSGTSLFFVYELEHLSILEKRLVSGGKFEIIALDYELELEMKKKGISYTPLRDLVVSPEGQREPIESTRRLTRTWYRSPELAFFQHDGILLGEQHEGPLLYYFQILLYYLIVLEQIFDKLKPSKVVMPESFRHVAITVDPTGAFTERLPFDVARLIAGRREIPFESIAAPLSRQATGRLKDAWGRLSQHMFRVAIGCLNALVTFTTRPRPIKLFASDPWSRIEPFIKDMNDVELVMTRRQEIRTMGIRNIWKTRARFHHKLDFVDRKVRELAHDKAEQFSRAWEALGEDSALSKQFVHDGISYWSIVRPVLTCIVTENSIDAIATIENTKRLFVRRDINCVLLFSSVKGYNNIIARVAEKMDIPSIELQHALSSVEPSHPYSCLPARYLVSYGAFTNRLYKNFGIDTARLVSVGSPRFDAYATPVPAKELEALRKKLHIDGGLLNILVAIPVLYPVLEPNTVTSYALQEVLQDFSSLQKNNPEMRFLLRPKPGLLRKNFYNREETLGLFSVETRMVQFDNLRALLGVSDFVISGNSALVLEALLAHKPVLMYLPRKDDRDFQEFEDAGAVLMARNREELFRQAEFLTDKRNREELVNRADAFLQKNFTLDGRSSERVAALIRRVQKA